MRRLSLLLTALAAAVPLPVATRAGGGFPVSVRAGGGSAEAGVLRIRGLAVPDTIVWPSLLAPRPVGPLTPAGNRAPPGRPDLDGLHLGLKPLAPSDVDLPSVPGAADPFVAPPGSGGSSPTAGWVDRFRRFTAPDQGLRIAVRSRLERLGIGVPSDSAAAGGVAGVTVPVPDPVAQPPGDPGTETDLGQLFDTYSNLDVRVRGRAEIEGDWSRFRPCQSRFQDSCSPRLFPQLSPDLTFAVEIGGTIADRINVDVDFDQAREFEAANRINMYYEGDTDAIVQRLEVGDVNFRLPPSRFLTEGIPAGNFGFQAEGQLGPWDMRAVWAEQKGDLSSRVFRLTGVGNQRRFVQQDTVVWDDADYADGQFFFLVDPRAIDRYPHVDILSLDAASAPPSVGPGIEPIQLYRFEADPVARQQVEGFIQADAVAELDGDIASESGWFRYLQPGEDYTVHASGLWVVLRNPLSRDEMLAVTYVTAVGDTVGDYNPEAIYSRGERPTLRLLKGSRATHQPGRPTWEQEMRNVYRVSGGPDVEAPSVEVTISLGELSAGRTFVRSETGEDITYLRLLGLDRESPTDEVDAATLYSPGRDAFEERPPVQGTFLVFPTLEPFKRPPPAPFLGLGESETLALLQPNVNRKIYDNLDPFERDNGGLFRITIPFRRRSENVISSFSLGALGVLDGSERIYLDDRRLVRGLDYEIDYDIGQVRLLQPEVLFAAQPDAEIRATWEQQQLFRTAPVAVFGFASETPLGRNGSIGLIGLQRTEQTLVRRPTLGLEPVSVGLAGLSLNLSTELDWVDGVLGALPGLRFSGPSSLTIAGETALSLPDPNTRGQVFVDDFDASDRRPLSLLAWEWARGSAPDFRDGAEAVLPLSLDAGHAAELVWQHNWILEDFRGDSTGIREGFLPRQEIDQQIRTVGSQVPEPALSLVFGAGQSFDTDRFASITSTLSQTGTDLTKTEFLEFYVAAGDRLTLVLDLGLVKEDALFVGPGGATNGVKENGVPWGLDLLDQEADPARGEIWGNEADRRGVWGEACLGEPGRIYRRGELRAVCTRNNGRRDTEDLDGDGNLGTREKYLRYVVRLDGSSPFLARDRGETGTEFRLYRVPIDAVEALQVGGPFTDADLRAVEHLRITVAGDRPDELVLARMRLIGSAWVARGQEGVLKGIAGDDPAGVGRVEVASVSRLTEGDAYDSPPGVLEELADPTSAFGGQGVEFNEKSLALTVADLQPGDRAEILNRFPQRPRDFLAYREARLWVTAREGPFGRDVPHNFFLKVGTDADNFYLFRTRLGPPPPGGVVASEDWLPEIVVDFDIWLALRRRAETVLVENPPAAGEPVTLFSPDSAYAIVLRDRGQAPDLANVREMSVGVWNQGSLPLDGEIWIDELRLGEPVRDAGVASHLNVDLQFADVLRTRATWSRRGAFFRQLEEDASYQTDHVVSLSSELAVERFLPAEWGVAVPLRVQLDDASQDPTFLTNSDVRVDLLRDLRRTGTRRTRFSVGFRKLTPSADPVVSALLDGLQADVAWFTSESSTVTSTLESEGVDARVGYVRRLDRRTVPVVPGFLEGVVRALLPGHLEDDVVDARLRWSPEEVSLGTGYRRHDNAILRFEQIIRRSSDSSVIPTRAPRESLESAAEISFRPFSPLGADLTFLSTRELLRPEELVSDSVTRELLAAERTGLGGLDLGWETNRVLRTTFTFRPQIVPWLRNDVDWTTSFHSERNANFLGSRAVEGAPGDTVRFLQRNAAGERNVRSSFALDPALIAAPPGGDGGTPPSPLTALLGHLQPVTFDHTSGITSRFNRDPASPGFRYQFGLGGSDDFRFQDGDTAATLVDRSSWRLGSGVRLPFNLTVTAGYATGEVSTLDTRSDRRSMTETWPDVTLRADFAEGISGTAVDRLTVSTGWVEEFRETSFGGQSQQLRRQRTRRVPLDVRFGVAGAATVAYTGAFDEGAGIDPTGDTDRDARNHRLSVSSTFEPPGLVSDRLDRPVSLSLVYVYTSERECRAARFRDECVAFVDQINRALSVTLGTGVAGFQVGLNSSYNDRQSFVGVKTGSTQFQFGVFGQFVFEAMGAQGPF